MTLAFWNGKEAQFPEPLIKKRSNVMAAPKDPARTEDFGTSNAAAGDSVPGRFWRSLILFAVVMIFLLLFLIMWVYFPG